MFQQYSPTTAPVHPANRKARRARDSHWQRQFLALLPAIRRHATMRFRGLTAELREEMIQETIARALVDYLRLVERGKKHLAAATPLARFAVAQVRAGRRVGGRLNGNDVSSEYCHRHKGVTKRSLDHQAAACGEWREVLVEDRHAGPADTAAMRIDFSHWLKSLPRRSRRLAERLATGESTSSAARWFGLTSGRVSQLRAELRRSWLLFQGEPAVAELT